MKNRSRRCPGGPKWPELALRGAKAPPKGGQGVPKWPQGGLKGAPDGAKRGPRDAKRGTWGLILIRKWLEVRQNRCLGGRNSENMDFAKNMKNHCFSLFFHGFWRVRGIRIHGNLKNLPKIGLEFDFLQKISGISEEIRKMRQKRRPKGAQGAAKGAQKGYDAHRTQTDGPKFGGKSSPED